MKNGKTNATYFSTVDSKAKTSSKNIVKTILAMFLAMATLALSFSFMAVSHKSPENTTAEAWSPRIFCSDDLGYGMDSKATWQTADADLPGEDTGGRRLSAFEMFGGSFGGAVSYVGYQGKSAGADSDSNDDWATVNSGKGYVPMSQIKPNKDGDSIQRINDIRKGLSTCVYGTAMTTIGKYTLNFASTGTTLISSFAGFAFSTNFVCEKPNSEIADDSQYKNSMSCVDMLGIIGGSGSSSSGGGIIGALTSSLYLPLLVLVVLLVAAWVAYKGIVQRQIRDALFGVLWTALAVIFGLAFLLNPALLAKAPAVVSNTIAGCVIDAFGGNSCASGSNTGVSTNLGSHDVCVVKGGSRAGVSAISESAQKTVSSLTCSIWKAFILEPYSQASFGTNFANLGTGDSDGGTAGKKIVKGTDRKNTDFCVNMQTSKPLNQMKGDDLITTSFPVCNIALYQLSLRINGSLDGTNQADNMVKNGSAKVDKRWFKVIDVASANDNVWNSWTKESGWKLMAAILALLSVTFGGIVIIAISVFAIVFYLASIFLMAFAPIFFLIGVHPGKGKDILKGYGEMVLSNVFKYIASALFLVVALGLYGGVLGTVSNPFMALLLVVVLSIALFMYRREVIDLIGTVNMGGTKMGQATTDKIKQSVSKKGEQSRRLGSVAVGSAVGSKMAGGTLTKGVKEGAKRELKREGGIAGQFGAGAMRTAETVGRNNENKLKEKETDYRGNLKQADNEQKESKEEFEKATGRFDNLNAEVMRINDHLNNLREKLDENTPSQLLSEMKASGDENRIKYAEMVETNISIEQAEDELSALDPGTAAHSDKQDEINAMKLNSRRMQDELSQSGELSSLNSKYETAVEDHILAVDGFNEEVVGYNEKVDQLDTADTDMNNAHETYVENSGKREASLRRFNKHREERKKLSDSRIVSQKDMNRVEENTQIGVEEAAEITKQAADKIGNSWKKDRSNTSREYQEGIEYHLAPTIDHEEDPRPDPKPDPKPKKPSGLPIPKDVPPFDRRK